MKRWLSEKFSVKEREKLCEEENNKTNQKKLNIFSINNKTNLKFFTKEKSKTFY